MPPLTLLSATPEAQLEFPTATSGGLSSAKLRLTNVSASLVAYKVKSTATKLFVIRPSAGSIRKGDSIEVQIARKPIEGSEDGAGKTSKRGDRFLVQAAVVESEDQKLLLHAAHRGKAAGATKFWDSVSKETVEEQQLEAVVVEGEGGAAAAAAVVAAAVVAKAPAKAKAAAKAANTQPGVPPSNPPAGLGPTAALGMPSNEDVDVILGKISLPGRSNPLCAGPVTCPEVMGQAPAPAAAPMAAPSLFDVQVNRDALNLKKKDVTKRKEDVVLQKHSRPVTHVAVDPAGNVLYTCGKDKLIFAWSLPDGTFLREYVGHRGAVWCCSVSADGMFFLSCGADNMVLLWEAQTGRQIAELQMSGVARFIEWAPAGSSRNSSNPTRRCVTCSNSFKDKPAAVAILEFPAACFKGNGSEASPRAILSIEEPRLPSGATQVAFAGAEGMALCSVHPSGEVLFWHSGSGSLLGRVQVQEGPVSMVAFPHDRTLMATCGRKDLTVKIWDLSNGPGQLQLIQQFVCDRPLNAVAVRPSLSRAEVAAALSGTSNGACDVLIGGGQDARDVALVGAGNDDQFEPLPLRLFDGGNLVVWGAPGAEECRGKGGGGHFGPIHTLAMTPDAALCVSAAEDGNVRLRELVPQPASCGQTGAQAPLIQKTQGTAGCTGVAGGADLSTKPATTQENHFQRMVVTADFDPSVITWPPGAQHPPLPIKRGQEIEVLHNLGGGGWAIGRCVGNPSSVGLFPTNYTLQMDTYQALLAARQAENVTNAAQAQAQARHAENLTNAAQAQAQAAQTAQAQAQAQLAKQQQAAAVARANPILNPGPPPLAAASQTSGAYVGGVLGGGSGLGAGFGIGTSFGGAGLSLAPPTSVDVEEEEGDCSQS